MKQKECCMCERIRQHDRLPKVLVPVQRPVTHRPPGTGQNWFGGSGEDQTRLVHTVTHLDQVASKCWNVFDPFRKARLQHFVF